MVLQVGPHTIRYRHVRYEVYKFLEQPQKIAVFYHFAVFFIISVSFCFSVLLTVPRFEQDEKLVAAVAVYEIIILVIFVTECVLRLWSCGSVPKYRGFVGMLRFIVNFYMIVDIVSIMATTAAVVPYKVQKSAGVEKADINFEFSNGASDAIRSNLQSFTSRSTARRL